MEVTYINVIDGVECSRCQRPAEGLDPDPGVCTMADDEVVWENCLTEAEKQAHLGRLLAWIDARMGELAPIDTPEAHEEFSRLFDTREELEIIQEQFDTANNPAELRRFVAAVELGQRGAAEKGEEYPADLIEKAEWARQRLLLLSL